MRTSNRARSDAGITLTPSCFSSTSSKDFTDGASVLHYSGKETLTFESIELMNADPPGAPHAQDFQLEKVELVPVRRTLVGSWARWPPPRAAAVLEGAVPVTGATMGAGRVTEYNLVAHLTRENVSGPVVTGYFRYSYSVGDREWGSASPLTVEVEVEDGCRRSQP